MLFNIYCGVFLLTTALKDSAVFSGGAGGARAPPEFGASEKGRSLISAYRSLALTTNTPGFKKLYTALSLDGAHLQFVINNYTL